MKDQESNLRPINEVGTRKRLVFRDLKKGDKFYLDDDETCSYIATSDAYLNDRQIGEIQCEPLDGSPWKMSNFGKD